MLVPLADGAWAHACFIYTNKYRYSII